MKKLAVVLLFSILIPIAAVLILVGLVVATVAMVVTSDWI